METITTENKISQQMGVESIVMEIRISIQTMELALNTLVKICENIVAENNCIRELLFNQSNNEDKCTN